MHAFIATPCPVDQQSAANPVPLVAAQNSHPDNPSTARFPSGAPAPLRADSRALHRIAPAALPRSPEQVAIPAAPLLSPHLSRAPAGSFAARPQSLALSGSLA